MILTDKDFYVPLCSCGKAHQTTIRKIMIESGCLSNVKQELRKMDILGHITAVYDSNTIHAKGLKRIDAERKIVLQAKNLHATEIAVAMLEGQLDCGLPADVLVAVGSGTVHDIVRYVAAKRNIPFVSCPTAATVDGFASSVAAMTWHGFKKTMPAKAPVCIFADLDVIMKAPPQLAASGVGDLLGKYICLTDWKIGHILLDEYYCPTIVGMMEQAIEKLKKAAPNLLSVDNQERKDAFETLIYGLILSGVAMQLSGNSRPASGAEHHISHLLELGVLEKCEAMHGEKVGIATPICADVYHALTALSLLISLKKNFLKEEQLYSVFGSLTREVIEENRESCTKNLTEEKLIEHWREICNVVKKIPSSKMLKDILKSAHAKSELADIGVKKETCDILLKYSPYVRNRLTLMRIKSEFHL